MPFMGFTSDITETELASRFFPSSYVSACEAKAIKMHNDFKNHDSIHRDVVNHGLSLDKSLNLL